MKTKAKTILILSLICGLFNMAAAKDIGVASFTLSIEPEMTETSFEMILVDTNTFVLRTTPIEPQISIPDLNLGIQKPSLGDSLFNASLISLAAVNVADYFSTVEALKHPGLQEGNPLMKPFVKNSLVFAGVKIGLTALNTIVLKRLYKKNKTMAWVVSAVTNIGLGYIVANNLRHIQHAKGI